MAFLDDLKSRRDALAAKLLALASSPQPTYSIDSQNVSHDEHRKTLQAELDAVVEMIVKNDPYWIVSQIL